MHDWGGGGQGSCVRKQRKVEPKKRLHALRSPTVHPPNTSTGTSSVHRHPPCKIISKHTFSPIPRRLGRLRQVDKTPSAAMLQQQTYMVPQLKKMRLLVLRPPNCGHLPITIKGQHKKGRRDPDNFAALMRDKTQNKREPRQCIDGVCTCLSG